MNVDSDKYMRVLFLYTTAVFSTFDEEVVIEIADALGNDWCIRKKTGAGYQVVRFFDLDIELLAKMSYDNIERIEKENATIEARCQSIAKTVESVRYRQNKIHMDKGYWEEMGRTNANQK